MAIGGVLVGAGLFAVLYALLSRLPSGRRTITRDFDERYWRPMLVAGGVAAVVGTLLWLL